MPRPAKRKNHGNNEWLPQPELVRENAKWEAYYKLQKICSSDEEFAAMKKAFQEPLPVGIRVNKNLPFADGIHTRCVELSQSEEVSTRCRQVGFLSDSWQWDSLDRKIVKKAPGLKELKQWLFSCEGVGALTRQEVVSMVPPVALDVQPGDTVLDMCAAPGSKTTQILEQAADSGLVLGNDVEWKRSNMLAHQVNRLCSPCAVVTNYDAFFYPNIQGGYDKILCDVPCTADGTLRKTPEIWKQWNGTEGIALHQRQLQILTRGLQLLKQGGRLVYSTCSLNPLENEAVIGAALTQFKGMIELEDVFADCTGIIAKEGLSDWKVVDPSTGSEVVAPNGQKFRKTMFPPEMEICSQLYKSRRFLPHLMNTGGFFVASFRKFKDLSHQGNTSDQTSVSTAHVDQTPTPPSDQTATPTTTVGHAATVAGSSTVDYFTALDSATWEAVRDFYGLSESLKEQLIIPKDQQKRVSFVSREVLDYLKAMSSSTPSGLRIVSTGVRAFQINSDNVWNASTLLRLTQEGATALTKYMTKRVLNVDRETFFELITKREITPPERLQGCQGWDTLNNECGAVVVQCEGIVLACVMFARNLQVYADKVFCASLTKVLQQAWGLGQAEPTSAAEEQEDEAQNDDE